MKDEKMMSSEKTFLIITSDRTKLGENSWDVRKVEVEDFCNKLRNELPDLKVIYTTYNDLEFTITKTGSTIYDLRNQISLDKVDLVHFKNWQHNQLTAPVVARYLKNNGIAFYNSEVINKAAVGKLAQMFILSENNIPVPKTFLTSIENYKEMIGRGELPEGFEYPVIFKADDASKGEDNFLVKSEEEFVRILQDAKPTEYLLQEFVPNEGDLRILFVGVENQPLVFLRKGAGDTHLNNTSQGGTGALLETNGEIEQYVAIARRAAMILGKEIGGVDVIVHKETKEAAILEVNGTPAIATGFGREKKIELFVDFLTKQLKESEGL